MSIFNAVRECEATFAYSSMANNRRSTLICFHGNPPFSPPNFMTYGASLWDTIRLLHLRKNAKSKAKYFCCIPAGYSVESPLHFLRNRLYRKCSDRSFRRLAEKNIPNCAGFSFGFKARGRRIVNDVTVIATQKLDDKDKRVGIFFDRNRLGSIGCPPLRWIPDND